LPRLSGCHFLVQNLHQCYFYVSQFCPRGWWSIRDFPDKIFGRSGVADGRLSPISLRRRFISFAARCFFRGFNESFAGLFLAAPQTNPRYQRTGLALSLPPVHLLVNLSFVINFKIPAPAAVAPIVIALIKNLPA